MKTIHIALASLLAASVVSVAQSSHYSSSNYKMPMHAKVAKDKNLDKSFTTSGTLNKDAQGFKSANNYKSAFQANEQDGSYLVALPIEVNVVGTASRDNYKNQFRNSRKSGASQDAAPQQEAPAVAPTAAR